MSLPLFCPSWPLTVDINEAFSLCTTTAHWLFSLSAELDCFFNNCCLISVVVSFLVGKNRYNLMLIALGGVVLRSTTPEWHKTRVVRVSRMLPWEQQLRDKLGISALKWLFFLTVSELVLFWKNRSSASWLDVSDNVTTQAVLYCGQLNAFCRELKPELMSRIHQEFILKPLSKPLSHPWK